MDALQPRKVVRYLVIALRALFLGLALHVFARERQQFESFCPYALPFVACPVCVQACPFSRYHQPVWSGILISSLAAGRIHCGAACPVGTIQDAIHALIKNIPQKARLKIKKTSVPAKSLIKAIDSNLRRAKYLILLFSLLYAAAVYGGRLGFLPEWAEIAAMDYAAFIAGLAGDGNIHFLVVFLVMVFAVGIFVRRPWCKYLCPYGLSSGLFNKISFIKLKFDLKKCLLKKNPVSECTTLQPLVKLEKGFRSVECIRCLDCVANCPKDAIHFDI